jgi:pimeloyl-ACP methyl ester carboxylesterase
VNDGTDDTMDREPQGREGIGRLLPAACLGAIALYALVVLVVVPEGTPSVLARLTALALIGAACLIAVLVARRAPVWLGGLGMLLVGFAMVAVLLGVVAERAMRRPSVSAALGLLAGAGAIALIVIGWQRLLAGMRRRWLRVVTAVLGTLAVAQLLLLPAVVALLVTNRARPVASARTPADLGLAFDDVRIPATDGTALAAWWIPSRNGSAVIVLPGSGSTRDDVLEHAAFVAEAGYGAVLLDVRGHGESGGRLMDLGWEAERDVSDVVTWLEGRDIESVGLLGLSMGGEIALTAAAEDPRIAAVVAEGATARTYADTTLVPESNPIARANGWLQFALVRALASEREPIPMIDAVSRIEAPTLMIEGSGPLEAELGPRYDEAAPDTFTLWSIPESPHVGGLSTRPAEYRERVLELYDEALT